MPDLFQLGMGPDGGVPICFVGVHRTAGVGVIAILLLVAILVLGCV